MTDCLLYFYILSFFTLSRIFIVLLYFIKEVETVSVMSDSLTNA